MKKICSSCHVEKDLNEFRKDKSKKDGVQPFCKICAREKHRSGYSEKYAVKYNARNNERRLRQKQLLEEYKDTQRCVVCGEDENCCLEFHHIDSSQKEFTIGASVHYKWERILEELKKCVCLCSNCHNKLHAGKIKLAR